MTFVGDDEPVYSAVVSEGFVMVPELAKVYDSGFTGYARVVQAIPDPETIAKYKSGAAASPSVMGLWVDGKGARADVIGRKSATYVVESSKNDEKDDKDMTMLDVLAVLMASMDGATTLVASAATLAAVLAF